MSTLHGPLPKLDCSSNGAMDLGAKVDTLPNKHCVPSIEGGSTKTGALA